MAHDAMQKQQLPRQMMKPFGEHTLAWTKHENPTSFSEQDKGTHDDNSDVDVDVKATVTSGYTSMSE